MPVELKGLPVSHFNRYDVAELLGITPICKISDEELWTDVVTPMTKGLIGSIVFSEAPRVIETTAGLFPGDDVSNLNDHRLYGGKSGFIRVPYIRTFYKTEHGAFIVKRDGVKVQFFCWSGDLEKGKGELVLKVSLRDRRFDGTLRANDTALLDYRYSDPITHKPLAGGLKAVELSVYSYLPGSSVSDVTGEADYEQFIKNPFTFLAAPEQFIAFFQRAWKAKRSPGQHYAAVADVSKRVLPALEAIAKRIGYDAIEASPSHYHVARWFMSAGFRFSDAVQAKTFGEFSNGLESIRQKGTPLTRQQQSWVCVIQHLRPSELIPPSLNLNGPLWPQTNLDNACLWMNKPLSDKAKLALLSPA
jgi:hypothetical protein